MFWVLSCAMFGLSSATTTLISKALGEGSILRAKFVLQMAAFLGFLVGCVVALVFVVAGDDLGRLYSDDPEVWHLTGKISTLVGCGYLFLAVVYVLMAALTAQGRPEFIALAFLLGAWIVVSTLYCQLRFEYISRPSKHTTLFQHSQHRPSLYPIYSRSRWMY